jgi:hypothetical protein
MGTVTGVLKWSSSGPPASANEPLTHGTVTFTGPVARKVEVNRHGQFSLTLPIGRYKVTGTSRAFNGGRPGCSTAGAVVVKAGQSEAIQVVCLIY